MTLLRTSFRLKQSGEFLEKLKGIATAVTFVGGKITPLALAGLTVHALGVVIGLLHKDLPSVAARWHRVQCDGDRARRSGAGLRERESPIGAGPASSTARPHGHHRKLLSNTLFSTSAHPATGTPLSRRAVVFFCPNTERNIMRLCTLLPIFLLAACGIPDDASPDAPTSSTGDSSSSSDNSSSSSSSSDSTSNAEDSSSGESGTPEDTSGSGGGGGSTGELSCGEVECDAPRFCMTHPQTGKRLCVEACTAAATCLVASEECITVAGLSTCFPALCDVLADCPDGSVECVNDFCH